MTPTDDTVAALVADTPWLDTEAPRSDVDEQASKSAGANNIDNPTLQHRR